MSRQLIGSILVALAIVAITIVVVTAQLGPNAGDDSGKRTEQRDDSSGKGGDEDGARRRRHARMRPIRGAGSPPDGLPITPLWASPSCGARHPRLGRPGRTACSPTGS